MRRRNSSGERVSKSMGNPKSIASEISVAFSCRRRPRPFISTSKSTSECRSASPRACEPNKIIRCGLNRSAILRAAALMSRMGTITGELYRPNWLSHRLSMEMCGRTSGSFSRLLTRFASPPRAFQTRPSLFFRNRRPIRRISALRVEQPERQSEGMRIGDDSARRRGYRSRVRCRGR